MDRAEQAMHVERAQSGDERSMRLLLDALAPSRTAYAVSRYYGFDIETCVLLALAEAIRTHRSDGGANLANWSDHVLHKRLVQNLMASRRAKHGPLSDALSLDAPIHRPRLGNGDSCDGESLGETAIVADERDLAEIEGRSAAESLVGAIRPCLAPLETTVFDDIVAHPEDAYSERTERLGINTKSLDNALMRIRCKAREAAGFIGVEL